MFLFAIVLALAPMGDGSIWDRLAQCESGGNWSLNSTFDGGLQFSPSTWTAMGGPTQYAYQASRTQQIAVAQRLWEIQGWGAWPGCANKLGLWGSNPTQDSSRVDAQNDAPEIEPSGSGGGVQAQVLTAQQEPADHAADVESTNEGQEGPGLPVTL